MKTVYLYQDKKLVKYDLDSVVSLGQLNIEYIAERLWNIKRFSGTSPANVLLHSMWVHANLRQVNQDPLVCLMALLHDSTEIFYGDIPSGLKTPDLRNEEKLLLNRLFLSLTGFSWQPEFEPLIKKFDVLYFEEVDRSEELLYMYASKLSGSKRSFIRSFVSSYRDYMEALLCNQSLLV